MKTWRVKLGLLLQHELLVSGDLEEEVSTMNSRVKICLPVRKCSSGSYNLWIHNLTILNLRLTTS